MQAPTSKGKNVTPPRGAEVWRQSQGPTPTCKPRTRQKKKPHTLTVLNPQQYHAAAERPSRLHRTCIIAVFLLGDCGRISLTFESLLPSRHDGCNVRLQAHVPDARCCNILFILRRNISGVYKCENNLYCQVPVRQLLRHFITSYSTANISSLTQNAVEQPHISRPPRARREGRHHP